MEQLGPVYFDGKIVQCFQHVVNLFQALDLDLSSAYLTYTPGLPPSATEKKPSRPKTAKGKSGRPKTAKKLVPCSNILAKT